MKLLLTVSDGLTEMESIVFQGVMLLTMFTCFYLFIRMLQAMKEVYIEKQLPFYRELFGIKI